MRVPSNRLLPPRLIQNLLEYLLFLLFFGVARALPRKAALAMGASLGAIAGRLLPRRGHTARDNLRKAFPEMPAEEIEGHVKAMFRHIGICSMETLRVDLLDSEQDLIRVDGADHLREAVQLGRGVFILTGHLGFWEVGSYLLPKLGFPTDFIAKPMKNPYIDNRLRQLREAGGCRSINSRHAARKIIRSLALNRAVGVLLDQHTSRRQAVSVPFFGRPAFTSPVIAEIAVKYGVPVVPVFSYRTPENRYEVVIEPMLRLDLSPDAGDVTAQTALLTSHIEAAIRKEIGQWFWLHRRWRHYGMP